MNLKRLFLYVFIASVAASALIGIVVLVLGSFGEIGGRILATTFTITLTSILGLACGVYYESGRGKALPASGIALSVIAALICIYLIWMGGDGAVVWRSLTWKSAVTAWLLATAIAHLSLISLASLDSRFMWSRVTI